VTHRGDTSGGAGRKRREGAGSDGRARPREGFAPRDDWGPALGLGRDGGAAGARSRGGGDELEAPDVDDAERGGDERARRSPTGSRRDAVLERIRATPPGFVRTYGDVSPGAPRFAGTVLSAGHPGDVPWFRIVRADGSLAKGQRQRALLEAEGVPFRGEKVDMKRARLP
jgi:methylated-DNA-protein-cysteine methyltransferase related protein